MPETFPRSTEPADPPPDPDTKNQEGEKADTKEDVGHHSKKTSGWELGFFLRRVEETSSTPGTGSGGPEY
jgi:hypothetical protein